MKGKRIRSFAIMGLLVMAMFAAMATSAEAYTYNRNTAVNYALNNAYNGVPGSWYFYPRGGDCTNFVSWSLNAGGWPMRYWYSGGDQWYFSSEADYSNSWTVVTDFGNFAKKYRGYQINLGSSPDTIKSNLEYWVKRGIIQKGDLIQRVPGSNPGHTMIITSIDNVTGKAKVTYHSTGPDNQRDLPFDNFISQYPAGSFVAYHLLDNFDY